MEDAREEIIENEENYLDNTPILSCHSSNVTFLNRTAVSGHFRRCGTRTQRREIVPRAILMERV